MECPVCNKNCNNNETFCPQCSWEFKMYVGGTPPEEEQRLKIAKHNWQRILSGTTSNAEPGKLPITSNMAFENSLGMKFVYIEPGTFIMGSPEYEPERSYDEVQHKVTLTQGFYMQTTAVTVSQWRKFAKIGYKSQAETEGGAYIWTGIDFEKQKDIYWNHPGFKQTDDHPVTCISWNDAQAFIKWLSAKDKHDYRLPTEAEWEYACRAGTQMPFAFGNCLSADQANYNSNYPLKGCPKGKYREQTVLAGSLVPNAWGLYNMHGNVLEWCQDWYGDYPSEGVASPQGVSSGEYRVLRGGSWIHDVRLVRSARRLGDVPGLRDRLTGLRFARGQ